MTDAYSALFTRPMPRRMRPAGERMRDPNASVARQGLSDYRAEAAQNRYNRGIGPGGVVGDAPVRRNEAAEGLTAAPGRGARLNAQAGKAGTEAARAATSADYAPIVRTATPDQNIGPIGPGGVVSPPPTAMAASAVAVPQEFLDTLIGHESGGDPNARAPTSSATGHAQFIDRTWLSMMRRYAGRYGQPELAAAIDDKGKVRDGAMRQRILSLRTDPRWAALMAAHYARENVSGLRAQLGRQRITEGEAYLAHFLGVRDAAALIRAAGAHSPADRGGRPATAFVSAEAAQANRNIFYERDGRARTAEQVVRLQTRRFRSHPFAMGEMPALNAQDGQ